MTPSESRDILKRLRHYQRQQSHYLQRLRNERGWKTLGYVTFLECLQVELPEVLANVDTSQPAGEVQYQELDLWDIIEKEQKQYRGSEISNEPDKNLQSL